MFLNNGKHKLFTLNNYTRIFLTDSDKFRGSHLARRLIKKRKNFSIFEYPLEHLL
jgi:hypothetical protein